MDTKTKDAHQMAGICAQGRYARSSAGILSARAMRRIEEKERRAESKRKKKK